VDGVVNLVDAGAAAELESWLLAQTPQFITLRHGLNKSLNLFLEHYEEAYDFVYLFTDHPLPTATVAGQFEPVTRPAGPGGVSEFEIAAEGYETTGRVKGVVGFPYSPGFFPPLPHETLHYWAVDLDGRFGFGQGLDADSSYPSHWGYASVNGMLGGFDGSTLRCATPAGAMPPNCTAQAGGRIRYVTAAFAPQSNSFKGVPYAPMELYLMGLVPKTDVPASMVMLTAATLVDLTMTSATIEASGTTTIQFADIEKRHGTPRMLPANARHFDSAFVVVSSAPAAASVMSDVASFAAAFGNTKSISGWPSFEGVTGGRATMTTALGARRRAATKPPPPRAALTCDVLRQDCTRAELGCYVEPPAVCALSGGVAEGKPCDAVFACAPGLDCVSGPSMPNSYVCEPYCDPNDASAASACMNRCPGSFLLFKDSGGGVLGGLCQPK
jgi:hypothetical protein